MNRKRISAVLIAGLVLCMAVLGAAPAQVKAASPKLSKTSVNMFLEGVGSLKVKDAPKGAAITWKSSNTKVAEVSEKGIVTAKKKGTANITATVVTSSSKKELTCKVTVKKAVVVILDNGVSKKVKVKEALTVTGAKARGKKGGHADRQYAYIHKEAPKADIISIRVTNSKGVYYSKALAEGVRLAMKKKADIIYYGCYGPARTDQEYKQVMKAVRKGIHIVSPAGNEKADARKKNWMTKEKGLTVVGAFGEKKILSTSNRHANVYIEAGSTSAAAARYAGMLAKGKIYDDHYKK